ncbi:MAG TPA: phage major capsid protein [bacterium]|nr:phage major capsid protein [bacterium]
MTDVGLGQALTATGRRRSKVAKDAMSDNRPIFYGCNKNGGIIRVGSGRSYVQEALADQNDTTAWVGERGTVDLSENNVLDAAEYTWRYILSAVIISKSEELQNRTPDRYIPLIASKYRAAESTQMNLAHEGVLSSGTGSGGLQVPGLGAVCPTDPTTGTWGGIDHSSADAAWHRSQAFNSSSSWSDGTVDSGNVTRFLDYGIDAVTVDSSPQANVGFAGSTHWKALAAATRSYQFITAGSTTARHGHNRIIYRDIEFYLSGGLNYSGYSAQGATTTFILNTEPGGFNIVYMEGAEYDMLPTVESNDQALMTRLIFTMMLVSMGAHAKKCWRGFDP